MIWLVGSLEDCWKISMIDCLFLMLLVTWVSLAMRFSGDLGALRM